MQLWTVGQGQSIQREQDQNMLSIKHSDIAKVKVKKIKIKFNQ